MRKIWPYIRLYFVSMGFTLILINLKALIGLLLDNNQPGLVSFYKAFILRISESNHTWNSFVVSVLIFVMFLIYYRGKTPFPEDKFWLK